MLSYGLVLALFLLGPGFATYAGAFVGFQGGKFHAAPPPPNSIFSLAVVSLSSLWWHSFCAVVLTVDETVCGRTRICIAVPFHPNVYAAAFASVGKPPAVLSGADIAAFLLTCTVLSGVAFVASVGAVRAPVIADALRRSTYGLYAGLVQESASLQGESDNPYVTAYILTDMQKEGGCLGYVGVLENLQVGVDIPRLPDDPKILGMDDVEGVGHNIAEVTPVIW